MAAEHRVVRARYKSYKYNIFVSGRNVKGVARCLKITNYSSLHRFEHCARLQSCNFVLQNLQKGKISLAEIMFGMNLKETGIKRYPIRLRQRILQCAVTIYLKDYDPE